jgi:predicted nucleotidyltransferase
LQVRQELYIVVMSVVDPQTEFAVRTFLKRISDRYPVAGARLYGSRARANHGAHSDADLAVLLKGPRCNATNVGVDMAGIAFDVLLDTEIFVSPLPIWEEEWAHPESYSNPRLLETIRRDGIDL